MNGHPDAMLTNYELANWHAYLSAYPQGPATRARGSEGAFDAMPKALSRKTPTTKDFRRGGRYDFMSRGMARDDMPDDQSAPQLDVMAMLKMLATKLRPEDWAEFRNVLCGESGAMDDAVPENSINDPNRGTAMDSAFRSLVRHVPGSSTVIDNTGMQAPQRPRPMKPGAVQAFHERFPEAKGA